MASASTDSTTRSAHSNSSLPTHSFPAPLSPAITNASSPSRSCHPSSVPFKADSDSSRTLPPATSFSTTDTPPQISQSRDQEKGKMIEMAPRPLATTFKSRKSSPVVKVSRRESRSALPSHPAKTALDLAMENLWRLTNEGQ